MKYTKRLTNLFYVTIFLLATGVTNTTTVFGGGDSNTSKDTADDPTTINVCETNIIVANNADSGTGSLRQAITDVCASGTITFAGNVTSPITLSSELDINKSLTINGPGANTLTISGNRATRVLRIRTGSNNVTISGLTIANGTAYSAGGGGVLNDSSGTVSITNSTISGNSPQFGIGGGGILNEGGGTVSITNSTISGNSTRNHGGGIYNFFGTVNVSNSTLSGNSTLRTGGGIYNDSVFGTMSITNSTISGNSSTDDNGGGISNYGAMSIINSTVSGNSAYFNGGGIYRFSGTMSITNSTVSGNSSNNGGGIYNNSGTMNVKNTIIAANTAVTVSGQDVSGAFTSQGYNLIGKSEGSTSFVNSTNNDQVGTNAAPLDPMLGALADNGGTTRTMALLTGSPAIDKGSAATNPINNQPIATDQRGFTRPADNATIANAPGGNGSDIGAFEIQLSPTAASVSIGGRVTNLSGQGISNARVSITDSNGETHRVLTNQSGDYRFDTAEAGQTYIVSASHKRYQFTEPTRVVFVAEDLTGVDFIASTIKLKIIR